MAARFSPPYGDCTEKEITMEKKFKFSPPYGDGTKTMMKAYVFAHVFAPLRGSYTDHTPAPWEE